MLSGECPGTLVQMPQQAAPVCRVDVRREYFIHHKRLYVEGKPPGVARHFFQRQVFSVRLSGVNAAAEDLAHAAGVLHVVKVLVRDEKVRDDDIGLFGVYPVREAGRSVHRHVRVILRLEEITITGSYSTRINANPIHEQGL